MTATKPSSGKKYYTPASANATLPLVRVILRDVTELARELRERHERLSRSVSGKRGGLSEAHQEELLQAQHDLERGQQRMRDYERELQNLGIELKDYFTGLIDFPARMDGREVYLCWRLGEPEVAYWHELEAGFGGRQKLRTAATGSR
jgi:hypothetical protein